MWALLLLLLPITLGSSTLGWIPYIPPCSLPPIRLPSVQIASYYHRNLEGHLMANQQPYDGRQLTAAHRRYPLGSVVTLCREDHPLVCATVTVTDRGPWIEGREWDLSRAAARRLGMLRQGVVGVTVRSE